MNKKLCKTLAILLCLVLTLTAVVPGTMAFIVTDTGTVKNTFFPYQSTVSDLLIRKSVEHPFGEDYQIPESLSFDFRVELGAFYADSTVTTTDGAVTADNTGALTVSVSPGESLGISGLDAGTTVTVTELEQPAGFAVQGGATRKVTVSAETVAFADFTNVYTPGAADPTLTLTGRKILEGRDWQPGDRFTFLLEEAVGESGWKALGTRTVTYDADDDAFDRFDFTELLQGITFDTVGTYSFRLTEQSGTLEHIAYDKTVNFFSVVVTDTDMDGRLEISRVTGTENMTVEKDESTGDYALSVVFNNTFTPASVGTTIPITVQKTVLSTGKSTLSPENFVFVLTDAISGKEVGRMTSGKDGRAVLELTYTADDIGFIYHYTLSEVNDARAGVTYSKAVYQIQAAVTLGENGSPVVTVSVNGKETGACVAAFENTYNDTPDSAPTGQNTGARVFWLVMLILSVAVLAVLIIKRLSDRCSH